MVRVARPPRRNSDDDASGEKEERIVVTVSGNHHPVSAARAPNIRSAPAPTDFVVNPLSLTAAEIIGLDCAAPMDTEISHVLRQAYQSYPVLVFRDQVLSAQELAAFGRQFGPLEVYDKPASGIVRPPLASLQETRVRATPDQMLYPHPDNAAVVVMTNEALSEFAAIAVIDNAECWHSDGSHKPEPYRAIAVHALRNPTFGGGDTEFCDLRLIYDALPAGDRKLLGGLSASHHWSKSLNPRFAGTLDQAAQAEGSRIAGLIPPVHHPVVRSHPETGRPALYLSPRFTLAIDGASPDASEAILGELFALMDDTRFCYRHRWRERDLVIWDNRCLNHRVHGYEANDARRRHRITIAGDRPYHRPTRRPIP